MSVRAGIIVTGTEVLCGLIRDANGPWLSEQLRAHGVSCAHIVVVGDRPEDLRAALDFFAGRRPGHHQRRARADRGRPHRRGRRRVGGPTMELDPALEERVWAIVNRLRARVAATRSRCGRVRASRRIVPVGRGRAGAGRDGAGVPRGLFAAGRRSCPGRRASCRRCGVGRCRDEPLAGLLASAGALERRILRFFGLPEPQIAATLREIDADALPLEITTCLRRGELEVATVFPPSSRPAYAAFEAELRARHGDVLFSSRRRDDRRGRRAVCCPA